MKTTIAFLIIMNAFLTLQWFAHEGAEATLNQKLIRCQSERDSIVYTNRVQSIRRREDSILQRSYSVDLSQKDAQIQKLQSRIQTLIANQKNDSLYTR